MTGAADILDHTIIDDLRQLDPDGSSGFLASIVEVFDTQCDELLPDLLSVAQAGDADEIAKKAHKLKGSARTIGAAQVGQLCEVLEHDGRHSADGTVAGAVEQVEAIIAATKVARAELAKL